jgi:phospholipid-translocating ATPase
VRARSFCISCRYVFSVPTSADAPIKDIHTFIGTFTINSPRAHSVDDVPMVQVPTVEPLSAENVLWSNTVLAAGSAIGFIVYTGSETRAVMNTSHPETKVGLLDLEINRLAKVGLYGLVKGKG